MDNKPDITANKANIIKQQNNNQTHETQSRQSNKQNNNKQDARTHT